MSGEDSFGQRLAFLRDRAGHTQESLGAAVGVSRQTVWNLENGRRSPSHELLLKLAQALSIQPEELIRTGGPRKAESFEDRKAHQQLQTILDAGGERSKAVRVLLAAVHSDLVSRTTSRHGPKPKAANH